MKFQGCKSFHLSTLALTFYFTYFTTATSDHFERIGQTPSTSHIERSLKWKFVLHIRHTQRSYAMLSIIFFHLRMLGMWGRFNTITRHHHFILNFMKTPLPPNKQNCIMKKNSSKTNFRDKKCLQKTTHTSFKQSHSFFSRSKTHWLPLPAYTTDLLQPIRCRSHPQTEKKKQTKSPCQRFFCSLWFWG